MKNIKILVSSGTAVWKKDDMSHIVNSMSTAETPVTRLTYEFAVYHMHRVQVLHDETWRILNIVFNLPPPDEGVSTSDHIRLFSQGVKHIAGLIDLTLKLTQVAPTLTISWVYPEQLLHPAQQLCLADAILTINNLP